MKKFIYFFIIILFQSCREKVLTEVQVPLPEEINIKEKILMPLDVKADEGSFDMIKLSYNFDAFEPKIQQSTMEMHYSKIYLYYTNKLNKLVNSSPFEDNSIENILGQVNVDNKKLLNNASGYYNHSLFFESITNNLTNPSQTLSDAINADFGSFILFKSYFINAANNQFGSGWIWLIVNKDKHLQIINTQNEDNPLMLNAVLKGKPILCLDLWEHAYMTQNSISKDDYINTFFNHINWDSANKRYDKFIR